MLYLFCSDDDALPGESDALTDTIPDPDQHPQHDADIFDPQIPRPSNVRDLDIGKFSKDATAEPNKDIYKLIEER